MGKNLARYAFWEPRSPQTLSLLQISPPITLLSSQHPGLPRTSWWKWSYACLGGCWGSPSFYRP